MALLQRRSIALFACLILGVSNLAAATQSDFEAAERVLGPQWKQLSCRAGMVFAGTVMNSRAQEVGTARTVPSTELSFRIDRAIAGVKSGHVLTIHEWQGAISRHRSLRNGDHVLLFLYPPSRLGFTSPIGGSQGQISLNGSEKDLDKLERAIRTARGE